MPRKPLILSDSAPYHITNRSNNKEFFHLEPELLWAICMKNLKVLVDDYGCEIHLFILMSNHYHSIISTPRMNIGESIKYFQREVAKDANRATGRINHFFGGRYGWTLITDESHYWNTMKYGFRNPVRAGMCEKVEDYPFSSLNRESGLFSWKVTDFFVDKAKPVDLDLQWLNEPFLNEHEEAIQKALRRREFLIPKDRSGDRPQLIPMPCRKVTVT